ncbi:histidine phosphatase family protein [Shimia sp.]|uniref:histidine phosphatase family protein n=1 Tax=Shimia sp. TaxID=1954381 RepID=UPI003297838E
MRVIYLTHPQVNIDPDTPVPDWSLADEGRARLKKLAASSALRNVTRIYTSAERKTVETASLLAFPLGLTPLVDPEMGENDRSATGYLPDNDFEAAADSFFASPDISFQGWETARDAQTRILAQVTRCLDTRSSGDTLLVGHGAVGTLLYCALAGLPISRRHDQGPGRGGNFFTFPQHTRRPDTGWQPLEALLP